MSKNLLSSTALRSATIIGAAAAAIALSPAYAQTTETVTVTGTLIQGNTNLVSPVTVIDTSSLDKSGISSIQSALQMTLANNGPAITNSWTANGNFAQGASGISLRGLTTNSTLVMFNGMRAAYYPLADDGTRNFVDLNTIPDDIVENIQILRDGASSAYGADAIAGVVNVVTKKEFQGFSARAEGGIADRGDATQWKFSATAGVGDLGKDHVNAYITASYYHSDVLYAKSRPYPFNTYDWTGVCANNPQLGGVNCGPDLRINGNNTNGAYGLSTAANFLVRPYTLNGAGTQLAAAVPGSKYQFEDGCAQGTQVALSAAAQAVSSAYPASVCQYDYQNLYGIIEPAVTRFGLSGHTAFVLPSGIEGYVEANFMQDSVGYFNSTAAAMYGNAPAPVNYARYSTSANYDGTAAFAPGSHILYLPVYVCAARTNCNSSNGTLNPNNPFASSGNVARVFGRDWYSNRPWNETRDRTYRVGGELNGSLFSDWKWNLGVTAMHTDLRRLERGYVYIQHELDEIADGTYNWINPLANNTPLAQLGGLTANQYLKPDNVTNATSDLAQAKFSVTAPLYKLPGGDLTVVAGASIVYEAVDAPSANSDANGPTQRYYTLNAFGTKGSRDVYAGYFEINAPVLEELVLNVSGRYDSYSSGQSSFSPKFGFWSKPLDWLTFKGTYSEGFRIPSFAEANASPTTGYVSTSSSLYSNWFLNQYGCSLATYTSCTTYVRSYSYGETTLASPHLKPENSRSWVFDLTLNPTDELTVSTTYYNIKKTNAITSFFSQAIQDYYAGLPIPAGYTIVPDAVDVAHPGATPRISTIATNFVNATAIRTAGFDFAVTWDGDIDGVENFLGVFDTFGSVHMNSTAQADFIQNLDTKFPDGHVERYDGTLGNFNLTAGTGTPKWRGLWQTTFTGGDIDFTSTLNWNSGYNQSAMDQGTGYRDCGLEDGSVPCRTADYFTWDVNVQYKLTSNIKIYGTMLNVLDAMPPVDTTATYSITGYNVVVGGDGILGRYLKLGVKLDY